jgi:hypothetical protein
MNDLHLWRLLRGRHLDPGEIIPRLADLATLPLAERMPFLGLLSAPLADPDPKLRAAALSPLSGARGRLALQKLVAALADPEEQVRLAAVDALRESVKDQGPRWAHALFHPEPSVRLAAIAADKPFPAPFLYKLFLLADPHCRGAVERQLAEATLEVDALPLLFDYLRRAMVSMPVARRLTAKLAWVDWQVYLADHLPRSTDMTSSLRDALQADWPEKLREHYNADRLDDVLHLFWEPDAPADGGECRAAFFDKLFAACMGEALFFWQWIAFTLLGIAAQRGTWAEPAAVLCATLEPGLLTCPWVPRDVRYAAVAGLYRAGERCMKRPPEEVRLILGDDLCWAGETGGARRLDLWAVGGVLRLLQANPYQYLIEWVGLDAVLAACREDLERAVPFLALPDGSARGRRYLIRELCFQQGGPRGRVLALLARAVASDALDFLDPLDPVNACHVLEQLLQLEAEPDESAKHEGRTPRRGFSENKTRCLARILARKLAAGQVPGFLRLWLGRPNPEDSALGQAILGRIAHEHDARGLLPAVCALETPLLRAFLTAAAVCPGFPYDQEVRLAELLAGHVEADVRAWTERRLGIHHALRARHAGAQVDVLAEALAAFLAERSPKEAATLLQSNGAHPGPRRGLVDLLRRHPDPVEPNLAVCQSLLASHDPADEVAEQFARFASADPEFVKRLDEEMVTHWRGEMRLPLLGHAWLYRWDAHAAAFAAAINGEKAEGVPTGGIGLAALLRWARWLPAVLKERVWEAGLRVLEIWRWQEPARWAAAWDRALGEALADALPTTRGIAAAHLIMASRENGGPEVQAVLADLRPQLVARMPDLSEAIRDVFKPWIDATGLPATAPAADAGTLTGVTADQIRTSEDLDFLADCAYRLDDVLSPLAGACLVSHGEPGLQRLAEVLGRVPPPTWLELLAYTITDWPEGPALESVCRLVRDGAAVPRARFRLGQALHQRGEAVWDDLIDAACRLAEPGWFQVSDYHWLGDYRPGTAVELALRLVRAPHPHAYSVAVFDLVAVKEANPDVRHALLEFLEFGTERMRDWRLRAADWLYSHGEREPVLAILLGAEPAVPPAYPALLAGVEPAVVEAVTSAVLMAGLGDASETHLLALLNHGYTSGAGGFGWGLPRLGNSDWVDPVARQEALARLLAGASCLAVRQQARRQLRSGLGRAHKLRRLGETFAWGVRVGRQLTGKLFTLEMIAGEALGYTRLRENKLYISPLPLLRGHQNGREVVRALILHEYGHHLYHKSDGGEEVWDQSEKEGLQRLLNLVSDEHLERNLRARDRHFGDQLKQLAAYAFQHTSREVQIDVLLGGLRGRAFEVLSATHLGVARREGCVVVSSGRILLQMEKAGLSFPRFFRSLRMGLGNRHDDPKVEAGLNLFRGRFRQSTMPQLLETARELRRIFGDETDLLESFNQDDALACDWDELADAAEGITNEELQAEVRRAMEGGGRRDKRDGERSRGRLLNRSEDEQFELITNFVPKIHDPTRHAAYAQQVARPAGQMRRYLHHLGLGLEPQRFRLRGKSFDRTRARAVVLRGDPRMLVAREIKPRTDLFLGVLIDCSGSMSSGDNIEKAKLFATLLAEAARGNRGVDLRLWGFTDRVIYDCGTAARPAVHDLEADDGNNDAAALWHAAEAARASGRRAKMLVMISDGSPTQCSVNALRALVQRLTRQRKLLCAQVAVRPLDEECFPHYVLLEHDNPDECVRRFGAVMMRLVRQALQG